MLKKLTKNISFYKKELKENGANYFLQRRLVKVLDFINYTARKSNSSLTFTFRKKEYHYSLDKYNYSWKNERTVEIPIVWDVVQKNAQKEILELGNVLSHYHPIAHTVLDKYEKGLGVINEDAVTYKTKNKFDLIISISTLEHIGWDEKMKDPLKTLETIKNLKKLLKPNGEMVITFPLSYNPYLDTLLQEKKLPFTQIFFLKRVSSDNQWEQSSWKEVKNVAYNSPFPNANALVVGILKK